MITAVVTGIGLSMMDRCLTSINPFPDEVIVVMDDIGRMHAEQSDLVSADHLKRRHPQIKMLHNRNHNNWQYTNQTINIGIEAAKNDWVCVIHEDTDWSGSCYFLLAERFLGFERSMSKVSWETYPISDGIHFPIFQMTDVEEGRQKEPYYDHDCMTQQYGPTSTIFRKSIWCDMGGFKEDSGIWYDMELQEYLVANDLWLYYHECPPIKHWPSLTYRANNWAGAWSKAPLWGNSGVRHVEKYGHEFTRTRPGMEIEEWLNRKP